MNGFHFIWRRLYSTSIPGIPWFERPWKWCTSSASIVQGTRVFQTHFFLLDQPLCSFCYKICACHRTHHQIRKRTGVGAINARRTITITDMKGMSSTATDTGAIPILYVCLIPLKLLKQTPPRTESWLGWGRRPGKKYGGRSREDDTMKFWCRRKRSRGRSVLPSMDMVRLLEAMMAEHWRREY